MADRESSDNDVGQRIDTFLGEFRILLPALGALLGFQLTVAFSTGFTELATQDRALNFAALAAGSLALLFLLVPASYHRHARRLDQSFSYLRFAQVNFSIAFVFLPLSLSLSLYVQAVRSFESRMLAAGLGAAAFVLFAAGWWLLPVILAHRRQASAGKT